MGKNKKKKEEMNPLPSNIIHLISKVCHSPVPMTSLTVLIPPSGGSVEGIDSLADEVGILGGEFCGIEAGNDTDERHVTLNVVAPMILAQAEAEDVIKLRFGAGQLDVSHHVWLCLLVQEPVVTVTLYVSKLCLEGISIYMLWLQPTMLEAWEHDVIAILNLLDFHIVYCLVNRSVSFTRITFTTVANDIS